MRQFVVLLLAGGDSTRLWPFENKQTISFFGKPLIYHTLSQLERFNLTHIVIVYPKGQKHLFTSLSSSFSKMHITFVEQIDLRGMAGAVISARPYIENHELLVISPSDIYEDILLSDFSILLNKKPDGILSGTKMDSYFPGGYLSLKGDTVIGIVEKPHPSKIPSNIVRFVFDYFKSANTLLTSIEKIKTQKDDIYEKAISNLITQGLIFKLLFYSGFWGYIKYPWHILTLLPYFLGKLNGQKIKNAIISDSAVLEGHVYIGEGVKILENVKIVGPTYIGDRSVIGNNSVIRQSIIGEDCIVGFTSEIARSFIGNYCWFHHNYVGDSILDNGVHMGFGAVTANFRLDEQFIYSIVNEKKENTGKTKLGACIGSGVHIGVNTSLMPGVKIGKNSFISSSSLIESDIANNRFVMIKNGKLITKINSFISKKS